MERSVIPIADIDDLGGVAADLKRLMLRADNKDLSIDFPATVAKYTGDLDIARRSLELERQNYHPGRREMFIAYAGGVAVGLSVAIGNIKSPDGVNSGWPNLSGFVCRPFRGLGIGRMSLEARMQVVDDRFGGRAWTLVRKGNLPSEHLISSVGFERVRDIDDSGLYLYHKKTPLADGGV